MTPKEAAEMIGCSVRYVRTLCTQGKLKHRRKAMPGGGYYYWIAPASVLEFAATQPPSQGWTRGKKRN